MLQITSSLPASPPAISRLFASEPIPTRRQTESSSPPCGLLGSRDLPPHGGDKDCREMVLQPRGQRASTGGKRGGRLRSQHKL